MFVLFCACDVMNVLSVIKNENFQKKKKNNDNNNNKVSTFCRCIAHISSIIDINRFVLLTTGACCDFFYPLTTLKNHMGGISNVKFSYNTFSK
jgi:hypothetical protein